MPERRAVVIVFVRRVRRYDFIQAPRLLISALNIEHGTLNWIRLLSVIRVEQNNSMTRAQFDLEFLNP
jgi:hypothetical protein